MARDGVLRIKIGFGEYARDAESRERGECERDFIRFEMLSGEGTSGGKGFGFESSVRMFCVEWCSPVAHVALY